MNKNVSHSRAHRGAALRAGRQSGRHASDKSIILAAPHAGWMTGFAALMKKQGALSTFPAGVIVVCFYSLFF
jgi:hypothetical protein